MSDHLPGVDNPEVHHEESDVNIRAIFGFGAGLAVVSAVVAVICWMMFVYFDRREAEADVPRALSLGQQQPPEPRLQPAPREDLRALRAREEAVLQQYGWADRNAGSVRIPIDQAMKLLLERGLPARAPEAPEPAASPLEPAAAPPAKPATEPAPR